MSFKKPNPLLKTIGIRMDEKTWDKYRSFSDAQKEDILTATRSFLREMIAANDNACSSGEGTVPRK
jgi:hypothetical protein